MSTYWLPKYAQEALARMSYSEWRSAWQINQDIKTLDRLVSTGFAESKRAGKGFVGAVGHVKKDTYYRRIQQ